MSDELDRAVAEHGYPEEARRRERRISQGIIVCARNDALVHAAMMHYINGTLDYLTALESLVCVMSGRDKLLTDALVKSKAMECPTFMVESAALEAVRSRPK